MDGRKILKPILAFVMALVSLVGTAPFNLIESVHAAEKEKPLPYIYVDGERISIDDERFQNVVAVKPFKAARLLRAAGGGSPNVSQIAGLPGDFERTADISMDGTKVSAQRYIVMVDEIGYEAYCCDPKLPGPETNGAVYELAGEANAHLRNALVNGYPINTEWSNADTVSDDDRMWWTYVTRVAVAVANNSTRNFTGDEVTLSHAQSLAEGSLTANDYPPIMVNGLKDAQDTGSVAGSADARSNEFVITHNRKTNLFYNPFRFEWADGTPDGAKLLIDGNVIATAPENADTVFGEETASFQIEMPNTEENAGKTAAVNLVGIHNQFGDKIWLVQNPNAPDSWQDIVFHIPEVSASAAFSFQRIPGTPDEAELRIIKQNDSGKGLSGAVFEISGPNGYSAQETSPSDGTIKLTGLTPGEYTITEVTPPTGHKIAEPASATVTIAANNPGAVEKVFVNEPEDDTPPPEPEPTETSVKIQKVDALTRENIPGALIRLRGLSSYQMVTEDGQIQEIDNTGINVSQVLTAGAQIADGDVKSTVADGVWTLEGLPYGAYEAVEERAPENYSLLPQHTAYSFWLLPGNVVIKLNQEESTVYVDDVMVSVHEAMNAAIAGIQNYDDAEALASELQGILDTLLSQLKVDAVFTVEADQSTNSHLVTFENYPFGQIEVTKYDMVTEEPLAGAHIRVQGYFPEGNTNGMPIDRVQVTGSDGKTVFEDLPAGQYTVTEVEAPGGYDLDYTEYRSISLTWGQTASTSFYNKPKTFLEVTKIDGNDSSKLLDGAVFRLTDPLSGEFWEGTTVGGKVKLGEGEGSYGNQLKAETVYTLTEIQAPPGYVLDPTPKEVILAANNQLNIVTIKNFLKPILTIRKYDELTNESLADASFRLWKTEGETWSELQVTDENGEITWTDLDPGIYSIQEIDEPYGYFQDHARKEILLEGGDHKELEFFNRPRPVLTILKRDAVTGEPLADVKFRVQRVEGETIGEFLTDTDGKIELSPKTGYLLEEEIYRVTEVLPPNEYLLSAAPLESVLLKWYEPTELIFENVLKPTLIFIKRDGMSGRGISGATYKIEYESPMGGVTNIGSYVTKCGLIVIPHVLPGWYILTETSPAPGYELPTNPAKRVHFAPGENSYTYDQTHEDLYVDPRTNPNNGERGDCGDWCGYLCSVLCAGNCGNPGDGGMSPGNGGKFGNITITNGKGDPMGGSGGNQQSDTAAPVLSAGTATRTGNMTAAITFTSSEAGKTYSAYVNSGANAPNVITTGLGSNCVAGANTITVYLTSGAKDVYIKVKDANGNVSGALKVAVPAYSAETETPPDNPPNFDDIIVTGGTVVYLNPDFSTVVIKFGNY